MRGTLLGGDDTYLINAVEMVLHALDCMVLPVLHILRFKHLWGGEGE